ncbi:hypothetical protein D3C71_1916180 [compost metagenome]
MNAGAAFASLNSLLNLRSHFHFPVRDAVVNNLRRGNEFPAPFINAWMKAIAVHLRVRYAEVLSRHNIDVEAKAFTCFDQIQKVI